MMVGKDQSVLRKAVKVMDGGPIRSLAGVGICNSNTEHTQLILFFHLFCCFSYIDYIGHYQRQSTGCQKYLTLHTEVRTLSNELFKEQLAWPLDQECPPP